MGGTTSPDAQRRSRPGFGRPRLRHLAVALLAVLANGMLLAALTPSIEGEAGPWVEDAKLHLDHPLHDLLIVGYRVEAGNVDPAIDLHADAFTCQRSITVVGYGLFWLPISTVKVACGSTSTVAGL